MFWSCYPPLKYKAKHAKQQPDRKQKPTKPAHGHNGMPRSQSIVAILWHPERVQKVVNRQKHQRGPDDTRRQHGESPLPAQEQNPKHRRNARDYPDRDPFGDRMVEELDDDEQDQRQEKAAIKTGRKKTDI